MSSCAVVGYDPKRVEPISGLHTLAGYHQSSGGYLGQCGIRLRSLWNVSSV